jgi:putative ABC transport system ATP-binding protein
MLIEVEDLSRDYLQAGESLRVLRELSFTVEEGDFIAIMGPSGSGKSTLMHILGGLDRPSFGNYCFAGRELSKFCDDELSSFRNREIGFVFQAFHLIPQQTVLQNVLLPSHYAKSDESKETQALKLLESVGLSDRLHFYPNQLSGGQCQRVAITRALLNDPSLILADEPTGNLDTETGDEIMGLLKGLHSSGKTILMVTHEREIACHAQKIMYMLDGRISRWETV